MTEDDIRYIHAVAAEELHVNPLDGSRRQPCVLARAFAAEIAREHGASTPQVGRALGRDHTTVLNYRSIVDGMRAWPQVYANDLRHLDNIRNHITL